MKTLAIVIGNDKYHESAELKFAVKDSQGIADVFIRLGYDVIHRKDIDNNVCAEILKALDDKIAGYDATIFFFAGHGFQFNGENYLTSVNCQIPPSDVHNCRRNSIQLSELMDIYKKHPSKINIVIIDACRRSFGRGAEPTFAPIQAPKGTLVAFSTSPEEGAKDGGMGDYGIYAGALLQYIGRELLSVEELFKRVRRTVYNLTNGKQTPWEHTSLIGDFYFNTGQLIHSPTIPYSEDVVKDANYKGKADEFSALIEEAKSADWNRQNPAFETLLRIPASKLDKNQQFILGRNLLQASGYSFKAGNFFENLSHQLSFYQDGEENHVLNGILFEIYFDSRGEFRHKNIKLQSFDEVMAVRKNPKFKHGSEFITALLHAYKKEGLLWVPTFDDQPVDVDIFVTKETRKDWLDNDVEYDLVHSINTMGKDILEDMRDRYITGLNQARLRTSLAMYLGAPESLVKINSNTEINNLVLMPKQNLPGDDLPF
ncbi:MAG: hypothetical protein JWR12_2990 [Mucilaginibacter sp.]|nr:hypothetical protein [Mucilaginibacter sp.]